MTKQELSSTEKHYRATIEGLVNALTLMNGEGQTGDSHGWIVGNDAGQGDAFGDIYNALVKLAGQEFVDYWCSTNEISWELADRSEHRTFKCVGHRGECRFHRVAFAGDICSECQSEIKEELLEDEAELKLQKAQAEDVNNVSPVTTDLIEVLELSIQEKRSLLW